ncbi:MAG: hypothetical protein ACUVQ0_01425 [Thermoproteota archaeon]
MGEGFEARVSGIGLITITVELGVADANKVLNRVVNPVKCSILCKDCGSCALWCPVGAIKMVSGRPLVDEQLCLRCDYGRRVEKCPVTAFLGRSESGGVERQATCYETRGSGQGEDRDYWKNRAYQAFRAIHSFHSTDTRSLMESN